MRGWRRWLRREFSTRSRSRASMPLRASAAEYFKADTVLLGFADESRVWIKSYWGEPVRELPRRQSIFELVLAEDGPVVVPDISKHPQFASTRMTIRRLEVVSFASVPVRSREGRILGALTIFACEAAPRHGRGRAAHAGEPGRYGGQPVGVTQAAQDSQWASLTTIARRRCRERESGRASRTCATLWTSGSLCFTTSRRLSWHRAGLSDWRR